MTYLSQNSRIPSMTIRRFPKWTALQFALDFYAFAFIIVFVFTQGLENTPLPPFLKFALGFFAIVWIGFIIDRTPPSRRPWSRRLPPPCPRPFKAR